MDSLTLTESRHEARSSTPTHAHVEPYLSVVMAGGYTETVGSRTFECRPLDVRFHAAGEEHHDIFGHSGAICLNLEFAEDWANALSTFRSGARPLLLRDVSWLAHRIVSEFRCTRQSDLLTLECLTAELFMHCASVHRDHAARETHVGLRRTLQFLADHYRDRLTLHEIALYAKMHPTHLARTFRLQLGCTIGEYVRRTRVAWCQLQLRESDHPISRIAHEAGFADNGHFTRTFRRVVGTSPQRFRQTLSGRRTIR